MRDTESHRKINQCNTGHISHPEPQGCGKLYCTAQPAEVMKGAPCTGLALLDTASFLPPSTSDRLSCSGGYLRLWPARTACASRPPPASRPSPSRGGWGSGRTGGEWLRDRRRLRTVRTAEEAVANVRKQRRDGPRSCLRPHFSSILKSIYLVYLKPQFATQSTSLRHKYGQREIERTQRNQSANRGCL